jgi:hypothetical protein
MNVRGMGSVAVPVIPLTHILLTKIAFLDVSFSRFNRGCAAPGTGQHASGGGKEGKNGLARMDVKHAAPTPSPKFSGTPETL